MAGSTREKSWNSYCRPMPAKKNKSAVGVSLHGKNSKNVFPIYCPTRPPHPIFALLCTHQAWAVCRMLQTISKFVLWLPGANSTELRKKGTFWAGSCQTTSDFSLISTANCAEFDVSPCPAYLQCLCLPLRFLTCKSPGAHATSKCAHACEHDSYVQLSTVGCLQTIPSSFYMLCGVVQKPCIKSQKTSLNLIVVLLLIIWSAWELLEPCRASLLIVLLVKRCLGNLVT